MIFDADHSFLPSNAFPQGGDCGAPGRKYLTLVVAVTPLLRCRSSVHFLILSTKPTDPVTRLFHCQFRAIASRGLCDSFKGSERESGEVLILRGFLKGTHSAQNCLPNSTVSPKCLKIEGSLWK
jgi:hypothetical protein